MLRNLKNKLLFGSGHEGAIPIETESATFTIKLHNEPIATLDYDGDKWVFKYTDELRNKETVEFERSRITKYHWLLPILDFRHMDKVYESRVLWPFFIIRMPHPHRPDIQPIIEQEKIDTNSQVALLTRFGKRSISNPYTLVRSL